MQQRFTVAQIADVKALKEAIEGKKVRLFLSGVTEMFVNPLKVLDVIEDKSQRQGAYVVNVEGALVVVFPQDVLVVIGD